MSQGETTADALTGTVVAAVEPQAGATAEQRTVETHGVCLNCGAALAGSYCAACGQSARVHRSISSIAHDLLHSVFHFDGKLWRTLPELLIRPGRLTRRYIEGERARFISPMALYLLSAFLMYALFSFSGGVVLSNAWTQIPAAQDSATMEALANGDLARVEEIQREVAARRGEAEEPERTPSELESALSRRFEEIKDNPGLFLYKLQTNGYKFLWTLVPLSIPFMWLLFCWRRDIRAYDHAVFVTYSMSFMVLLLVLVSLLGTMGLRSNFITAALFIVPPIHMYKQLRGAYGLSTGGTIVRLFFLLLAAAIVLLLYLMALVLLGLLG
jgi:hypothetical protein